MTTHEVVLHPAPAYAHVAVGADALRAAASWTGRWLGELGLGRYVEPVTRAGQATLGRFGGVHEALGFDPLGALSARLRRRD